MEVSADELALDRVRLKRKTLDAVLDQCQRALASLSATASDDHPEGSSGTVTGRQADELSDLVKPRFESPEFLENLERAHQSVSRHIPAAEGSSWDMISKSDIRECGSAYLEQDDYVLVSQEDAVDGIACFMAAYLLSLKQTKELTPDQLRHALNKTFSVKKKQGKLQKAWDGSKAIYNVVSWGATAVGIYQNPLILGVASDALCASCRVILKLL